MLTEEGTAKLLDFGLAKLRDDLSSGLVVPAQTSRPPRSATALRPLPRDSASGLAATQADPHAEPHAEPGSAATLPGGNGATAATLELGGAAGLDRAATLQAVASAAASGPSRSLTVVGAILGTPAYMAPEAWRSETATERTDVYGLGAILYELCCGHPPHDEESLEALALAAIDKDVRPLAAEALTVDLRLAVIIDRCLRRDPLQRYASGEELAQALEALASEVAAPTARAVLGRALRRRWRLALCAAVLLVLPPLLTLRYFYQLRIEQRRAAAMLKNRRAVAIIGLQDRGGGQHAGFAAAFLELLGAELTIGEYFRRVPADSVARMKIDLKLPAAETYPRELLGRIRDQLGTDLVVSGAYQLEPRSSSRLQVHIVVQDAQSAAVLASADVGGSPSELLELVARTGSELRQKLGITSLSAAETAALRAARPTSQQVAVSYAEGRDRLRHFDAVGARRAIEKVIAKEPDYPLGHLAMADVLTALGYDEKAKAEARRAFELAANLPREDRYLIEARHRESQKEWDQALAAYQTLLTFFPESLDYGLYLGSAQLAAGQPEAALGTIRRMRALPPPASQDPRLDLLEARAAADRSDYDKAQEFLKSAAKKGEALGAPLLVARAHLESAYALAATGQYARAIESATRARPLFAAAGDRVAAADALMAVGAASFYQGELARALAVYDEALGLLFEVENSALTASSLVNVALMLVRKGDLRLARYRAEGGMLLAREIGLQDTIGGSSLVLGWIDTLQGDLAAAFRSFDRAEAAFRELGDPKYLAWLCWHRGQALLLRGEIAAARRQHEEALALRRQLGLKSFVAESQAALAALDLAAGQPAQAAAEAADAVAQFAADRQADSEAWAQSLLAEALAAQGRTAEAGPIMARALALTSSGQSRIINIAVRRRAILFQTQHEKTLSPTDARRALDGLLAEATAAEMTVERLELVLAQQLLARGQADRLVPQLHAAAQEALGRDLGLLAKKIDKALQSEGAP